MSEVCCAPGVLTRPHNLGQLRAHAGGDGRVGGDAVQYGGGGGGSGLVPGTHDVVHVLPQLLVGQARPLLVLCLGTSRKKIESERHM